MLACAITTGDDHCQWLSPISNLLRIGQLPLLQALYGSVVIPESVYAEIRALESFGIDTSWLVDTEWIAILPVGDQALVERLKDELDPGEAEAIALAIELKADRLLMDERLGRQVAQRFSLRVTGLLGVLVAAIPVWWFWPVGSHGLSGVNYGLLGYLLVIGWLEKRPLSLALSLFALVAYGGLLPTLLPFLSPPGVSWIGHVSGFLGGVLAALAIHRQP